MFKKILVISLIFLLVSFPVNAMEVVKLDKIPSDWSIGANDILPSKDGIIPVEAVQSEVYLLQKQLPYLKNVNFTVYAINERFIEWWTGAELLGRFYNNDIYLFSNPDMLKAGVAEHTIDHEIGHFSSHYLNPKDLMEYGELRYSQPITIVDRYDKYDEVFAEDFWWLFGSDKSKIPNDYRPNLPKPREKEKEWILNKILEKLSWQDHLEFYKVYPKLGQAEIIRSEMIEIQKLAKGDIKGANSAHVWADQIRQAIKR